MTHTISIVVLNYTNWQDTVECIESVLGATYRPIRLIVVDNDSKNDSLEHIAACLTSRSCDYVSLSQFQSESGEFLDCSIVLIQATENKGYAYGNNIGLRWALRAGDKYALILNNDTLVHKDFLEPLVEFLEIHSTAAMAGPKVVKPNGEIDITCARRRPDFWDYLFRVGFLGRLRRNNYWFRRHHYFGEYDFQKPKEVAVISGSCMLLRMETLEISGLLDEATFLFAEEFILHEKFRRLQMKTHIIPESCIIHKGAQSTGTSLSPLMQRSFLESHRHYLRAYRGYPSWLVWVLLANRRLQYSASRLKRSWFRKGRG